MEKLKSTLKDFRDFAMKGNVLDLAIGVIIGGAFGKIVSSLVNDIIMPLIGLLLGRVDFKTLSIILREPSSKGATDGLALNYGMFIQNIVDFLIIAGSVYLFVKLLSRFRRKEEAAPAPDPDPAPIPRHEVLLEEIRDLLKEQNHKRN